MRSAAPARRPAMAYAALVRASIEALPPRDRIALAPKIWADCLAGRLSEAEAEALVTLAQGPAPAHSRPVVRVRPPAQRSPDRARSIARRRSLAASGVLPSRLAASFTTSECSVLSIVGMECRRRGACELSVGAIAARAGVSRRTAQNALRAAERAGLILTAIRRQTAFRNNTNRIVVASADWLAWLKIGGSGGGRKFSRSTDTASYSSDAATPVAGKNTRIESVERRRLHGKRAPG